MIIQVKEMQIRTGRKLLIRMFRFSTFIYESKDIKHQNKYFQKNMIYQN